MNSTFHTLLNPFAVHFSLILKLNNKCSSNSKPAEYDYNDYKKWNKIASTWDLDRIMAVTDPEIAIDILTDDIKD